MTNYQVKTDELKTLFDSEAVAVWNVLQFALNTVCTNSDLPDQLAKASAELMRRGIPHVIGQRTSKIIS